MEQQACSHCGNIHEPFAEDCPVTGRSLQRPGLRAEWIFLGLLGLATLAVSVSVLLGNDGLPMDAASLLGASTEQLEQIAGQTIAASLETATDEASALGAPELPTYSKDATRSSVSEQTKFPELTISLTESSLALATVDAATEIANATRFAGGTDTTTPTLAERNACDGAPPSRLVLGMRASVSFVPPLANRVRVEAGTHARILGHIQPGEEITILEGPGCAIGWVWWRVRSLESSLTGWTAEGDEDNYWLIPME